MKSARSNKCEAQAVIGAFTGAAFGYVGGSYAAGTTENILGNALAGGISSELNGGKFGHGFIAAGFTSGLKGEDGDFGIGTAPDKKLARVVTASLVGGTASAISGGKFANGAVTGALSHMLNAEKHIKHKHNELENAVKQQQVRVRSHARMKESLGTSEEGFPVGGFVYKHTDYIAEGYSEYGVTNYKKDVYYKNGTSINTLIPRGQLYANGPTPNGLAAVVVYQTKGDIYNIPHYNSISQRIDGVPVYVTYEKTGLTHIYTSTKNHVYSCVLQGGGEMLIIRLNSILSKGYILILTLILFSHQKNVYGLEYVSVHQLRIQHYKFLNKRVYVKGYFARGEGLIVLFATKDDAIMLNSPAAIPLVYQDEIKDKTRNSCMNHYVSLQGIYKEDNVSNFKGYKLFMENPAIALDLPENVTGTDRLCNVN